MLKKMLHSRKGISPILATLLLIVIAVAAVIVTWAWVMTFVTSTTGQATVIGKENIRYYGSPTSAAKNRTDVVIRNTGTADAKVVAVYWSSSGFSALARLTSGTDYDMSPTTGVIAAQSYITITVKWGSGGTTGSAWTSGTTYYFKVVTEAGQYLELSEKAP